MIKKRQGSNNQGDWVRKTTTRKIQVKQLGKASISEDCLPLSPYVFLPLGLHQSILVRVSVSVNRLSDNHSGDFC